MKQLKHHFFWIVRVRIEYFESIIIHNAQYYWSLHEPQKYYWLNFFCLIYHAFVSKGEYRNLREKSFGTVSKYTSSIIFLQQSKIIYNKCHIIWLRRLIQLDDAELTYPWASKFKSPITIAISYFFADNFATAEAHHCYFHYMRHVLYLLIAGFELPCSYQTTVISSLHSTRLSD